MSEDKASKQLQDIMGWNRRTPMSQAASGLGMILWGAGLIKARETARKMQSYTDTNAPIISSVKALNDGFSAALAGEQGRLESDLANRANAVESEIRSGLEARGIGDAGVAASSVGAYRAGLSGAYAKAHDVLARAKVNAESGLASSVANYYINLAEKQFKSEMDMYAAKMGIWGSLGGVAGSLLDAGKATPTTPKSTKTTKESTKEQGPAMIDTGTRNPDVLRGSIV